MRSTDVRLQYAGQQSLVVLRQCERRRDGHSFPYLCLWFGPCVWCVCWFVQRMSHHKHHVSHISSQSLFLPYFTLRFVLVFSSFPTTTGLVVKYSSVCYSSSSSSSSHLRHGSSASSPFLFLHLFACVRDGDGDAAADISLLVLYVFINDNERGREGERERQTETE